MSFCDRQHMIVIAVVVILSSLIHHTGSILNVPYPVWSHMLCKGPCIHSHVLIQRSVLALQ